MGCVLGVVSFKIKLMPTENEPIWRGASWQAQIFVFCWFPYTMILALRNACQCRHLTKCTLNARARATKDLWDNTSLACVYKSIHLADVDFRIRFGFSMVGPLIPIGAIAFKYSFVLLFLVWERNVKWSIYFDIDTFIRGTLFVLCS